MKKVLSTLLSVLLMVSSITVLFTMEAGATGSTNLLTNGDIPKTSDFVKNANNFSLSGFAGSYAAASTTSSVAVMQDDTLPDSVKTGNKNVIQFNLDSTTVKTDATVYSTDTYTLKENTSYEMVYWVKTSNLYGLKFYVYEPTNYISNTNTVVASNPVPAEGQNQYMNSWTAGPITSNPTYWQQRVCRTDITNTTRANGVFVENAATGTSNSTCVYTRFATAADIAAGLADSRGYYDVSKAYDKTNANNGWVKVTMSFKTKSGVWNGTNAQCTASGTTYTDNGLRNIPYSTPVRLGLASCLPAQVGSSSTLSVAGFGIYEKCDISSTVDNTGGKVGGYLATPSSINADVGENVTLKAVPYPGNTFLGWYKNDVQVSTDAEYTFSASGPDAYVAKFNITNLINDPGFESYPITSPVTPLKGTEWFVAGTDATWMTVNAVAGTTAIPAHNGTKLIDFMTRNNTIYRPITGLTANTDYQLSFYWYMNAANNTSNNNRIQKVNVADSAIKTVDAGTFLASASEILSTATWQKVTLNFNSGNSTSVNLNLRYYSDISADTNCHFYMDDLSLAPVTNAIFTLDCKESAAVVPVGTTQLQAAIGDTFSFKVVSLDTAPVVSVGGNVLTPVAGVYTFAVTGNATIKIVCAGDTGLPPVGKDALGNDLTKYQKDLYLTPVWKGDTVYHEPALFYTGRQTVKLLYPVDSVISLRSYDLKTYYVKGVDYDIENGQIKILPASRIPVYTGGLTHVATTDTAASNYGTEQAFKTSATDTLTFIGDTNYPALAIDVTYKHTTTWSGLGQTGYSPYVPTSQTTQLSRVMQKLENGQPVNIVIYGDSISCGWSSSGLNLPSSIYDESNTGTTKPYVINVAPYAPTWMDVVISELRARYPASTINVTNLALGGKDAGWGAANLAARLKLGKMIPDLMILAFAANDITGGTGTATYANNMKNIINNLRNPATEYGNPNADVLIWSQNLPNLKALCFTEQKFLDYQTELQNISNTMTGVGLTRITDTYSQIIKSKEAVDYLNTNVNHGNDFTVRMYEQHILAAMTPVSQEDNQAAANVVIGKISAIGTVTINSKTAIEDAELAYNGLTAAQQALVTNYSVLTTARSTYNALVAAAADQAAANVVIGKITAIGTVTLNSKTAIEDAEAAYALLTSAQKALVTNYSVLTDARSAYDLLAKAAADQAAADAVVTKINAIGTVTLSSKTVIELAESAYSALTVAQQALVTNYTVLTTARHDYNALVASSVIAGDINGDKNVDLIDVTILSRYVAGWTGLTYQEGALDTSGNGIVDLMDITLLSRFVAGWNVELHGGVSATNASLVLSDGLAVSGGTATIKLSLKDFAKLGGNLSGYQLTVTYDSSKLTFSGYTPTTAWACDSGDTTPGTAVIVAEDNNNSSLTITANGQIGTLNFAVKSGASGDVTVSVTVTDAANSDAVAYADGSILGSSTTLSIATGPFPL